jgi:hypothetical protein
MLVKDGGTLVLLIPAPEGIAPDHPQLVELGVTPGDEVLDMVAQGKIADEVAAATYLAFDQTRKRINVILVTDGIAEQEAARIGVKATPNFEGALSAALAGSGAQARIGVVTHGADVMGHFQPNHSE